MGWAWYVLRSKPHKESQLYAYLESQGFEVFFPTYQVQPANPRSSTVRPYFPRYMFVHVDLDVASISALKWAPGADDSVRFADRNLPVPDYIIHELENHLGHSETENDAQPEDLDQDDSARVDRSRLTSFEALSDLRLSGLERIQTLFEILEMAWKERE